MSDPQTPRVRRALTGASVALFLTYFALGVLRGEIVWVLAVFVQLAVATWAVLGSHADAAPGS